MRISFSPKEFLIGVVAALVLTWVPVILLRFVPVWGTPLMLIRYFQSDSKKSYHHQYRWVDLKLVSPSMAKAVIAAEDSRFYEHNGFDFEAIEKAIQYNKKHHNKKGASTISQQTAKNVFLWPHRSWLRKGMEAYFTVLIEWTWPKERILEIYLNVVELGHGVYGVEAAAQKFFHKSAARLTNAEAALLAAVLPNPRRFQVQHPTGYILNRRGRILARIERPRHEIVAKPVQIIERKDDDENLKDIVDDDTPESELSESPSSTAIPAQETP